MSIGDLNIETFYNTSDIKRFYMPAQFFWGSNSRESLYPIVSKSKKTLFFIDVFFKNNQFVSELLQKTPNHIVFWLESEPTTGFVSSVLTKDLSSLEYVIAIGGGSTMDASKAVIAQLMYGIYGGLGYGEYKNLKPKDIKKPKLISLPTTAGTGAEVSRYYVVYNSETKKKTYGRSWDIVSNIVILDPYFLRQSPKPLLVLSAFDAFVHLFETFICKYERSIWNDMLSCEGIGKVIFTLDGLLQGKDLSDDKLVELQYAAMLGGVAISNVRTGNIHEAAGALLEESTLNHPETLFVFLKEAILQYKDSIRDREAMLLSHLQKYNLTHKIQSMDDIITFWEKMFAKFELDQKIKEKIKPCGERLGKVKKSVFERVNADRVWMTKESPVAYSEKLLNELIDKSFGKYF